MIDIQELKEKTDLLRIAERDTQLKRVATTGGGEWAGPCPFCGGKDRFRLQPHHPGGGIWLCRVCQDGRWQDVISYVMQRDGMSFKDAIRALGADELPEISAPRKKPVNHAYKAPGDDWQAQAMDTIEICEGNLWGPDGATPLEYIRKRGLMDHTIKHFRLGYSPGVKVGELWIERGIVIPCVVNNEAWYLKIRLPSKPGDMKYRCVKGSRTAAIFNADDLLNYPVAVFVEGEFDAMIAWQRMGYSMAVCTLGSATNRPDLASWGPYLMGLKAIMAAYDGDPAGEQGLAKLAEMSERVKLAPLPEGNWKDVNDYFLAGGDLWDWIAPYFESYAGEYAQSLDLVGANLTVLDDAEL